MGKMTDVKAKDISMERENHVFFFRLLFLLVALVALPLMFLSLYFNQSAEDFYKNETIREGQKSFLRYAISVDAKIGNLKSAIEFFSASGCGNPDLIEASFPEIRSTFLADGSLFPESHLKRTMIWEDDGKLYLSTPWDSESVLLSDLDKELLFLPYSDAAFIDFAVLSLSDKLLFQRKNMPFLTSRRFLSKLYLSNGSFEYEDDDGEKYMVMNYFSPNTGWIYIGVSSIPFFYSSYSNLSNIFFTISSLMLIVSIIVAIGAALRISTPVRKISKWMRNKEEGTLMHGIYGTIQKTLVDQDERIKKLLPLARNEFFRDLVTGRIREDSTSSYQYYSTFRKSVFILITLFHPVKTRDEIKASLIALDKIEERATGYFDRKGLEHVFVHLGGNKSAIIINSSLDEDDYKEIGNWKGEGRIEIAISSQYEKLDELKIAYQENEEKLRELAYQMDGKVNIDGKLRHMLINAVKTGSSEDLDGIFVIYDEIMRGKRREEVLEISNYLLEESLNCLLGSGVKYDGSISIEPDADIADSFKENTRKLTSLMAEEHKENANSIIGRITLYIEENLSLNIGLQEVASYVSLSPSYTSRLIKENLNMGIVEYISTLRVERAKNLLRYTDATVEKIGYQVGFQNVRSFMRTFKQYTSLTPGQWRSKEG